MKAVIIQGVRDIRVEERPDPRILAPGDAVVRVTAACVCGSDLWGYRGIRDPHGPRPIGHELVGVVEEVGDAVRTVKPGDFVISPFSLSDGTCQACRAGMPSACDHSAFFASNDRDGLFVDGAQGERVR
ncbi:MAG TPA: alcohol dehydrogenase catalytic domain-containing protein, partial [Pseudolysinimonas sp.]|nr:alcohol dehydrogenase catalytic domain-containing protein [Pseudolysinimonas sp.]